MATKFIGDSYDFPCANREENYGGAINVYINWEQHLMYPCADSFPVTRDMKMRDFLENCVRPSYRRHPDTEKLNFDDAVWQIYDQPFTPDLEKSLEENGIGHQTFLRFRTPGLEGLHGVGN